MTPEQIKLLQNAQLDIMQAVHEVCVRENIKYYIIGGTALGAVRHGGFIPWDIDIDIAMLRDDYDAFAEVCKKGALPDHLTFHNYETSKRHSAPHALVSLNGSLLTLKRSATSYKCGIDEIFIDIFPLDTAPADLETQKKHQKRLLRIKKIKDRKIGKLFRYTLSEKIVKKVVSLALTPWSLKTLGKIHDNEMRRYRDCGSGLVCTMPSQYSYFRQLMPESIYGEPKLMKFEDREFFAPQKIEEYLTLIYNDYMQLPPENQRQIIINYFKDVALTKPENYKRK